MNSLQYGVVPCFLAPGYSCNHASCTSANGSAAYSARYGISPDQGYSARDFARHRRTSHHYDIRSIPNPRGTYSGQYQSTGNQRPFEQRGESTFYDEECIIGHDEWSKENVNKIGQWLDGISLEGNSKSSKSSAGGTTKGKRRNSKSTSKSTPTTQNDSRPKKSEVEAGDGEIGGDSPFDDYLLDLVMPNEFEGASTGFKNKTKMTVIVSNKYDSVASFRDYYNNISYTLSIEHGKEKNTSTSGGTKTKTHNQEKSSSASENFIEKKVIHPFWTNYIEPRQVSIKYDKEIIGEKDDIYTKVFTIPFELAEELKKGEKDEKDFFRHVQTLVGTDLQKRLDDEEDEIFYEDTFKSLIPSIEKQINHSYRYLMKRFGPSE
ncbi:uncharacterized protein L201_007489 [Kwoniella dendrophila CBS 6074]|uniref:Uncharacterized protein n=1 Tax=Kwoniella dendrophila CBS 6074 TaxID=1295534 RepID=A0AAX4K4J4_9TREE